MSSNSQVAIGPGMSPDEEADHKRRLAREAADQAEAEAARVEEKLDGMKEALKAKKAEAKQLRNEADRLEGDN